MQNIKREYNSISFVDKQGILIDQALNLDIAKKQQVGELRLKSSIKYRNNNCLGTINVETINDTRLICRINKTSILHNFYK